MNKNETPAGAGGGGSEMVYPLSPQPPEKSSEITWDDLLKIEFAMIPLMILSGGDGDDRDDIPPQALVRLNLRMVWRELSALSRRVGGGQ
ncbi:hypothetical protein [Trichloromonas sp.]|uniref:hypothetical protein n=1 Tax=Trichloromonas sp. TaxID=3069249 RepID=UPI002A4E02F5|nr:hypothetical protein [Trichloromonas sp.]